MRALLSAVALSLPLLAQASTNLVVNGGFEGTVVANGSWVNVSSLPGWSVLAGPGAGFEVRNNIQGSAFAGVNYIELDTTGNTTIGQSFSSLSAGSQYRLSFAYSPRINVAASSNGIDVLWNGTQLGGTLTGTATGDHSWTVQQFIVTAQGGTDLLSFRSVGTSDQLGGSLDAVSLVSVVPEPGSLAMLLAGLIGVAAIARRRGLDR